MRRTIIVQSKEIIIEDYELLIMMIKLWKSEGMKRGELEELLLA